VPKILRCNPAGGARGNFFVDVEFVGKDVRWDVFRLGEEREEGRGINVVSPNREVKAEVCLLPLGSDLLVLGGSFVPRGVSFARAFQEAKVSGAVGNSGVRPERCFGSDFLRCILDIIHPERCDDSLRNVELEVAKLREVLEDFEDRSLVLPEIVYNHASIVSEGSDERVRNGFMNFAQEHVNNRNKEER